MENLALSGAAARGHFRVWENDHVDGILRAWRKSRGEPEDGPSEEAPVPVAAEEGQSVEGSEQAPVAPGEDVVMQE